MYKQLFLFSLIAISGCNVSVNQLKIDTFSDKCPQQSPSLSQSENIELNNASVSKSGLLDAGTGKVYEFIAKSGQLLNFSLDNEGICSWIFDPTGNQIDLANSAEMGMDGTYSVYLWNPQGSKTFNLTLGLQDKPQPVITSSPKVDTQKSNYPKDRCGDSLPSNKEDYPVSFYPVNIPYTENNLTFAKSNFCKDAFQKTDKDSKKKVIQVASFVRQEKALSFADFVGLEIENVYVGNPTVINYR